MHVLSWWSVCVLCVLVCSVLVKVKCVCNVKNSECGGDEIGWLSVGS